MRTALLCLSAVLALFFAVSFLMTFFARDYVTGLAEDFVIDRTQKFADPLVAIAEQGIKVPGLNRPQDAELIENVRRETAEYRQDPRAYIANLVAEGGQAKVADPGKNAALKDTVLFWKSEIREYFQKTLKNLLFDLRIFFGSNLVAALLAFVFAWSARADRLPRLLIVCGLLLASVVYSSFIYFDEFSYFKILLDTHMGWWYPALLGGTFLGAYVEHGRARAESERVKSEE